VALVGHAAAAGMGRRSGGCQRERSEGSDKREQEQQAGNQTAHGISDAEPRVE